MSDPSSIYQFDAKKITSILNSFGCDVTLKDIKQPTVRKNFTLNQNLDKSILFLA